MPTDPVPALIDLAKATPDPRAIAQWLEAYLGTRPHDAKMTALEKLERELNARLGIAADAKAASMVLRIVGRVRENLAAPSGSRRRK